MSIFTINQKKRVYVNAGHFAKDPGCVINGIAERDQVEIIRDVVIKKLDEQNIPYVSVPDADDLTATIQLINLTAKTLEDGISIDIHLNHNVAGISGTECYGLVRDLEICRVLSRCVSKELGIPDRGFRPDTSAAVGSLGFCRKINNHAVVLEALYLDTDQAILLNGGYEKIAKGIVNGIKELYGIQDSVNLSLKEQIAILQARVLSLLIQLIAKLKQSRLGRMFL